MKSSWSWTAILFFFLKVLSAQGATKSSAHDFCQVSLGLTKVYRFQSPLIFKTNGDLIEKAQDENILVIPENEEVVISCGPNYLKNFGRTTEKKVKCQASGNQFVTEDGLSKDIEHYSCDLRVMEEVHSKVSGCTNEKWTATKFGFVHPKEGKTFIVGESCYDTELGTTIFAHVALGKENSILEKLDKQFLNKNPHPESRYKIDLFRSLAFDELYQRMEQELQIKSAIPLDLANYIDEPLLGSAQYQAVKKLGWNYFVKTENQKALEAIKESIQVLSLAFDLEIYTGSYGVATLYGTNNNKMEVYMDSIKKRFPMPKILWFLVKNKSKSLAFAVFNNRDEARSIQQMVIKAPLCPNQCDKISWLVSKEKIGDDVYCCSWEDLRKTLPDLPAIQNDSKDLLL